MEAWDKGKEGSICGTESRGKQRFQILKPGVRCSVRRKLRQPGQKEELVVFGSRQMATVMGKNWSEVEEQEDLGVGRNHLSFAIVH